jgi:hypothetical protein
LHHLSAKVWLLDSVPVQEVHYDPATMVSMGMFMNGTMAAATWHKFKQPL